MKDKINEKTPTVMTQEKSYRKREKFHKPLISDEDFKEEQDPFLSIVKSNTSRKAKAEEDRKSLYYISPIRGKVEDRSTFPVTTSRGRIGKQYDFLRSDKKLREEELKKNYGHSYYEFNLLNNKTSREVIKKQMTSQEEVRREEIKEIPNTFKGETNPVHLNAKYDSNQVNLKTDFESKVNFNSNFEEPKVNVIYEEEIEIDDNKKVVTSYEDNNKMTFFSDFDNISQSKTKFNPHVNIYEERAEEPNEFRADIKKLFAEYEDREVSKVTYEEEFEREEREERPKKVESNNTVKFNFINLKEELDESNKKPNIVTINKKPTVNHERKNNDLEQYTFPPIELLNESTIFQKDDTEWIEEQIRILDTTLESFGVAAKTVNFTKGPAVTRFEIEPEPGIKVSKITALQDDIKLRLAASDIRMEAPISGKSTVGVEVPNKETRMVRIREILESIQYKTYKSPLKVALGLDIAGEPSYSDISNMTHSLIAGSTGSGKSVCINTIIVSILYNAMPDEVKLVLIDPKKVEFSLYRDIPHLLTPVINDPKVATATLRWLTEEMDRRYELIESVGARDIKSYNIKRNKNIGELPKLPYIVVIIDELADLMMIAAQEVEEYIQRISQLARAAGIHLIVATQRPSTNVITGTIKTNIPTRISFKVASSIDSRIILDESGAERLLGKGDMLLADNGKPLLKRVQGCYISDDELEKITNYVKDQLSPNYLFTGEELVKKENEFTVSYDDDLFDDVVRFVIELGEASASRIQRQFKVGYNRAARLIDMMEKFEIIGPQQNGSKPREVLMSLAEYERLLQSR